jgi:hypothetical protein
MGIVYKFAPEEGINYLLREQTLRFSNCKRLNDIFEFLIPESKEDIDLVKSELPGWFSERHSNPSFSYLKDDEFDIFKEDFLNHELFKHIKASVFLENTRDVFNNFGVCSLSNSNDNPLMWSHYSNNYEGVCIGFESRASVFVDSYINNTLFSGIHSVKYSKFRPRFKSFDESGFDILLTKSEDWKYEKEVRCIRDIETDEDFKLASFKATDIREIILGVNMPVEKMTECMELKTTKYPNSQLFLAIPHPSKYRVKMLVMPENGIHEDIYGTKFD